MEPFDRLTRPGHPVYGLLERRDSVAAPDVPKSSTPQPSERRREKTNGPPLAGRAPHEPPFRPGSRLDLLKSRVRPYAAFGFLPGAGAGTNPDTRHCHASIVLVPS